MIAAASVFGPAANATKEGGKGERKEGDDMDGTHLWVFEVADTGFPRMRMETGLVL